jgi:ATP-dependent DNA helicase RecG
MDLTSKITDLPKIGSIFAGKFEKLGISTIQDIFYHIPSRYLDYSNITTIDKLRINEVFTIHAKIISLKNICSKRGLKMQIGSVEDKTGKLAVLWFNQPFLIKTLYPGRLISLSGKIGFFNRKLCLTSPDYELMVEDDSETMHTGHLVPIYPETSGLSSKWIRRKIRDAYELTDIKENLPQKILNNFHLAGERDAVRFVHFPNNFDEIEIGRKRLAFDELLNLELKSLIRKMNWRKNKVIHKLNIADKTVQIFIKNLPFKLTDSQKTAINEILTDMEKPISMNRLLEGDVGSGKTVVAATGMYVAYKNGFQSIIMAPTQILATQHYKTLTQLFRKTEKSIKINLITSETKQKNIKKADIYIGTHALLHKKLDFGKVAFVVIDEQHRFGVEQRKHLIKSVGFQDRSNIPHVLTMTATPIPRTVALTIYGDMDLSVLSDMPPGRLKVTTWVIPEQKRQSAYKWMMSQVKNLRSQIFIVCPLIEDSESETLADVKSVTTEFLKLKSVFKNLRLGLLHGRLKSNEKDEILNQFRAGEIDILVTTPVVEVGIDIPNATIMVIEASERFGLAGLHQLRGRVGRGDKKSYCLLFSNFHSGHAYIRLKAMENTHSGFELAELDLKLRGPGEIFGTAQSGFPELKVASWNNYELINNAKKVANEIIKNPNNFLAYNFMPSKFLQDN